MFVDWFYNFVHIHVYVQKWNFQMKIDVVLNYVFIFCIKWKVDLFNTYLLKWVYVGGFSVFQFSVSLGHPSCIWRVCFSGYMQYFQYFDFHCLPVSTFSSLIFFKVNFQEMRMIKPNNRGIRRSFQDGVWIQYKTSPHQLQVHAKINRLQVTKLFIWLMIQ